MGDHGTPLVLQQPLPQPVRLDLGDQGGDAGAGLGGGTRTIASGPYATDAIASSESAARPVTAVSRCRSPVSGGSSAAGASPGSIVLRAEAPNLDVVLTAL